MAETYVRWIDRITGQLAFRNGAGQRLMGTISLVLGDQISEGLRQAVRSGWIGDDDTGPADDALGPAGSELSLPRYPDETAAQYHARLDRAWDDWPTAGHETSTVAQLAAAGFPGAVIYHAREWPTTGRTDWWSQFWVMFPAGTHTATAAGPLIGSFTIGPSITIGPVGISAENMLAMRALILKFKPAHWICSGIIFEISGWTVGDGTLVGDPGLLIGGEQATIGVQ